MNALITRNYWSKKLFYLLTTIISLFFCEAILGQAPNIKTDSSFALFTAAGAISNTGSSVIWGDVGTYVGEYTGSQTVIGNIHVADSAAAKAAIDVMAVYSYMSGLSCDSIIDTPFGDSLVLVPDRVYCLTSASALNGKVILDAKGNSNGIFIIKINGALTTNTNSTVILKNSASFCNVYWQVAGAVDLGVNSTFKGTIIADGAISLLDNASLEGRALTRAGAISLYNNNVVGCNAFGESLPILLLSFNVHSVGKNTQLNWATSSEINNDYFTIQRSDDAILFQDILRIQAAGNSNVINNYSAFDKPPFNSETYYRLMQTDYDGNTTFSKIIAINFKSSLLFTVFPNPFKNSVTFVMDIDSEKLSCYELQLFNTMGDQVMNTMITEPLTSIETNNLCPGIYLYKIIAHNETIQSGCLISK